MKKYDFKKAHSYIADRAESVESASMGMNEDWFWTAEEIFADGEFKVDLLEDGLEIGGIHGSSWATPTLEIHYKDGSEEKVECSWGEYIGDIADRLERTFNASSMLGPLSGPAQERRGEIDTQI